MSTSPNSLSEAAPSESIARSPVRPAIWPAVLLVALYWIFEFILGRIEVVTFTRFLSRMGATALLVLTFTIWWWTRRRMSLKDRAFGFGSLFLAAVAAVMLAHPSMKFGLINFGSAAAITALTGWLVATRLTPLGRVSMAAQRITLLLLVCGTFGYFVLARMDGIDGEQVATMRWRWEPTPEELYLASRTKLAAPDSGSSPLQEELPPLVASAGDWTRFRGPSGDGTVSAGLPAGDWKAAPPRLLWKQRIGPAWSSMVVIGDRLFTQEQRGEEEAVVCYEATTGKELWCHIDEARFWESVAGAGPRATPAFADGRLFTLGATGVLNCFDAATGRTHWSRKIAHEAEAPLPVWGFCASPAVIDGLVVVALGGKSGMTIWACQTETGDTAWTANGSEMAYSSPQPARLCDKAQLLFFGDKGLISLNPTTGQQLWAFESPIPGAPLSLQPHVIGDSQVLVVSEANQGAILLDVAHSSDGWTFTKRWSSNAFKPSFNDFVVHDGNIYGFDGSIFCCVDLSSGKRRWKGGRYGHGQVILLPDAEQLIVVSEQGDLVLVAAEPEKHRELGKIAAITGKTWNHPALVAGRLYVRNSEEMAAFDLGPDSSGEPPLAPQE